MQSQMWVEWGTEESGNDAQMQLVKNQSFIIFWFKEDKKIKRILLFSYKKKRKNESEKETVRKKSNKEK